MEKADAKLKDTLDHVRTAAQELHQSISDAAAKHGGAMKADLEAISQKAKAVAESAKGSIHGQNEAAKKHITEAVASLEATNKHAAEALKDSGHAFETSVQKAVVAARAAVQHLSEAVAAKRSAEAAKNPKK